MLTLLVVNVGSTSLKFKLFQFQESDLINPAAIPAEGRIEGIGQRSARYRITAGDQTKDAQMPIANYDAAIKLLLDSLKGGLSPISAVCFKPVHARDVPMQVCEMTDDVLARMAEYNVVAPAHNPPVIAAVKSFRKLLPGVPMIGLFEPAFHKTIAPHVAALPVPHEWQAQFGIQKYGFHGASHRFIAGRVPDFLTVTASELRIVSCHLGGSSSLAAIRNGRSVDTTMAFSPQSGLPQGTRCGSLDPFVMIYLMKEKGWSIDQVAEALSKRSGLLGLSGVSAEFREIEAAAKEGNDRARQTIKIFARAVQCAIAEMTIALEGMNTLVFTGGIGERSASFRSEVCKGLRHLGVEIDRDRNQATVGKDGAIESADSPVRVLVLLTNEELVIARDAARLLAK